MRRIVAVAFAALSVALINFQTKSAVSNQSFPMVKAFITSADNTVSDLGL
jgi:hypothetical protein